MEDFDFMNLLYEGDDGLSFGFDTTGDNQVDTYIQLNDPTGQSGWMQGLDTTGNGVIDTYQGEWDLDEDGFAETFFLSNDYDQDGSPDHVKMYTDMNGDGEFDSVVTFHADNTDPNVAYRVEADIDFTGDHTSDYHYETFIPADNEGLDIDYYGAAIGSADANGCFDPSTPEEFVSGTPAKDMEVWQCQGNTNRCALFSQLFTIEQLTGQQIDIEEFADKAIENGWFSEEGGTTALNMDKMLTYYHVDHDMVFDSNMEQLESELNNGSKLIVSVDSGQIWYGNDNDIFSPTTRADHALQVIGIDHSDPNNPMVILNDSGSPSGCGEMVPLDVFENAWAAGDHQMIVCRA